MPPSAWSPPLSRGLPKLLSCPIMGPHAYPRSLIFPGVPEEKTELRVPYFVHLLLYLRETMGWTHRNWTSVKFVFYLGVLASMYPCPPTLSHKAQVNTGWSKAGYVEGAKEGSRKPS